MNSLNQKVVTQARTWLGTKYHHQGRLKKSAGCKGGVDCVGLLMGIINELDIRNERGELLSTFDIKNYKIQPTEEKLSESVAKHLEQVTIEEMIPGDVLLFKLWQHPQHVGILTDYPAEKLGFIHCNSNSGLVVEQPLGHAWYRMISHVYRFNSNCIDLTTNIG